LDARPILDSLTGLGAGQFRMKIKKIHAFAIKSDMAGGKAVTVPRRPSWLDAAEVAGPMSRFASCCGGRQFCKSKTA
jgi:hypothetical protein